MPRACHSGENALAGSCRLCSTLAAAPVFFHKTFCYHEVPKFWTCTMMYIHALEGLACARVSLRLARLPRLQAGCGARVASAQRLRLRQAFSRMLGVTRNIIFLNGSKT
jgi:hypothetical protein